VRVPPIYKLDASTPSESTTHNKVTIDLAEENCQRFIRPWVQ